MARLARKNLVVDGEKVAAAGLDVSVTPYIY